jgi:ribonuclease BN (tRNA processing enzyme)
MFEEAFDLHEYAEGETFEAAGFSVTPHRVLHYQLVAFGFRASANGTVLGYSGDSGPSDSLAEIARDADLFVCEATLGAPNPEGGTRGHLSSQEAVEAYEASGAKRLLLTHRPFERPLEDSLELAHDGLEIEVG